MQHEMRPDELAAMVAGFRQSRIILTAVELGVFTALNDGPQSSAEIAAELGSNPRATDRLLNALTSM
ncbi:MAG: methyltransferase dimerization domain-containing protein, partial [Bacteroidota bacterium]